VQTVHPEGKVYFGECGMRNFEKVYFAEFPLQKKHMKLGVICRIKFVKCVVELCQSVE